MEEMNEAIVRLINILEDRFEIPDKTDGLNVLMTFAELEHEVGTIWQQGEDTWTSTDLEHAVARRGIPSFINFFNSRVFLLLRK